MHSIIAAMIVAITGAIVGAMLSMWISHRIWKQDALKAASKTEIETLQNLKRELRHLWKISYHENKTRREFDAVDMLSAELSSSTLRESVMRGAEAQFHMALTNEEEASKLFGTALNDIRYYERQIHEMFGGRWWRKRIKKIELALKINHEREIV
jgi:hypothetical protein